MKALAIVAVALAASVGGSSMDDLLEVKNISVSIHRSPRDVYAFISNGENDVLKNAGSVSGKIIVTCSLPMNAANTKLVVAHTSSGAEQLARNARRASVISAFGTIPSEVLFAVFNAKGSGAPPSMLYCGNDDQAKKVVARLIRDVGFDPTDAGPLRSARYLEPFTMLIAQLAYEGEGGPALAYRFARYAEESGI